MRRLVITVIALVFVAGCSWPMFHHGPERQGFNPFEWRIGRGNVSTLVERWSTRTGSSVRSSPAVVRGVVYVTAENDTLYALDADSGAPRWSAPMGSGIGWSSPAVVDGVVYVGSGDRRLYAFDAAGEAPHCTGAPPTRTCTPLWTAATGGFVGSSPNVVDGIVYLSSFDNKLYAFDAAGGDARCSGSAPTRTCTPLWTAAFGGPIQTEGPAVSDGVVYVGGVDNRVYAFDASGGSAQCTGAPPDRTCVPLFTTTDGTGPPAVANGVLYVGAFGGPTGFPGGLFAFDAAGIRRCAGTPKVCAPLWRAPTGGAAESAPAVAYGMVFTGGGGSDHPEDVRAFDAAGVRSCGGSPRVCAPLWRATTGSTVESSPGVANGVVYVGSDDARIYGFDAFGRKGCTAGLCAPLWSAATGNTVKSSPAIVRGTVYVGSSDFSVYAFSLP